MINTMKRKVVSVTYMCAWCGQITTRGMNLGRPEPGTCPRRPKMSNGMGMPHRWVIKRQNYGV